MNLVIEYGKRHGKEFVTPVNEGLCFFNEGNVPALVCTTSAMPKCHSTCLRCVYQTSMIVELFAPHAIHGFVISTHHHVQPDCDLFEEVHNFNWNCKPVYLKNNGGTEEWLWEFFRMYNSVYNRVYAKSPDGIREQMVWCAINYPKIYNVYYTMYQNLVVGRKYLLFR